MDDVERRGLWKRAKRRSANENRQTDEGKTRTHEPVAKSVLNEEVRRVRVRIEEVDTSVLDRVVHDES